MKEYLREKVFSALQLLELPTSAPVVIERPRVAGHGDLTTNVAMLLAKTAKRNPRQLAAEISGALKIDADLVEKVEIAGPGFINFKFTTKFYQQQVLQILGDDTDFGRSTLGMGKRAQVEFVSANPTGPLTVGHGRGAVYGDTVANLLEWSGYNVDREYYFNNAGRQMRVLGDSVRLRYLALLGDKVEFPDDYYQGGYITAIAQTLFDKYADDLRIEPAEGRFKQQAEFDIFEEIKRTLLSLGVVFDSFFNEHSLYENGKITEVIKEFQRLNLAYEQDGAVWLKTSALGGEKDKVIVKSSGEPTYRLPDIVYHVDKFERGYDLMIDVFGSDHIATYPDVLAGVKALGHDSEKVRVLIHQFVTIIQDGQIVKMSTRKANFITLDELIEDVGADVVRYFFLMRSMSSHLNFDIGLARKHSEENPVFYLQYAHARIYSILAYASENIRSMPEQPDLSHLSSAEEIDLIKELLWFPDVVEACTESCEPHRLAEYLQGVASAFHKFYHVHRVVTDDNKLTAARLSLCRASMIVLRNGFAILGISAPERM